MKGSGIGLATCTKIIDHHQGRIWIESRRGEGSTFYFLLWPVEEGAAAMGSRVERGRVLVLDDEHSIRQLLDEALTMRGYHVAGAASPAEAMELAENGRFDFLIADIVMPDGSGLDIVRKIRHRHPDMKFIAVSGGGNGSTPSHLLSQAKEAGADFTFTKPFPLDEMTAAVAARVAAGNGTRARRKRAFVGFDPYPSATGKGPVEPPRRILGSTETKEPSMPTSKPDLETSLTPRRPAVTRRGLMAAAAGVTGLACLDDMALAYSQAAGGRKRSGTPKADRPRSQMKISSVKVTQVASPDRPIMNSTTAHATHFVRTITEIETSDGHRGVSEVGRRHAENIEAARPIVLGRDPFELEYFRRTIEDYEAFAGIEIACLDLIGRALNRRVCDLIGGAYREAAPYSAYVFFVLPTDGEPGVITPEAAAQQFVDFNKNEGFRSCKFKAGILTPDEEVEALRIMRRRVPDAKLRIDPNAAWSVETSKRIVKQVEPLGMEYLEDPTRGQDGMAEVRKHTSIPFATNMCVTRPEHIGPAYRKGAIDIVLLDVHHMGGLNNVRHWAATCEALGWGCSGHSNNHLGISMATLTHMNCSISHITYDADTHYPWTDPDQDIIQGGKLRFHDGKMTLPDAPGLGVEIDRGQMDKLEENMARVQSRDALVDRWNPNYRRKTGETFRF